MILWPVILMRENMACVVLETLFRSFFQVARESSEVFVSSQNCTNFPISCPHGGFNSIQFIWPAPKGNLKFISINPPISGD